MRIPQLPIGTPPVASDALNTPNVTDGHYYFASVHKLGRTGAGRRDFLGIGSHEEDENEISGKLHSILPVARYGSLIDSLPNELLSLVVELGYFDFADMEGYCPDNDFRDTLLQISHRFRQVTLCTPSVWSVFHLSQGNVHQQIGLVPTYLERSMEYPLDIRLSCFWSQYTMKEIMNLFIPHSKRWRRLSIVTVSVYILEFLQHLQVPLLNDLDVAFYSHERRVSLPIHAFNGSLPRLSTLCLRNINLHDIGLQLRNVTTLEIRGYGIWPEFARFSEMLSGSTSLEKLILHVKPGHVIHQQLFLEQDDSHSKHYILLPELRVFEVYSSEWLSQGIVSLIRLFTTPKLESLVLREGVGSASLTAKTIMSFTATPHLHRSTSLMKLYSPQEPFMTGLSNRLFVHCGNLSLACRAFPADILTSLELRRVMLPSHTSMKQVLSPLKNLKHLFFLDISPNEGLLQMLDHIEPEYFQESLLREMESTIELPNLETFMLDITQRKSTIQLPESIDYAAAVSFIRIFSLPALVSLILKNLTGRQWISIIKSFRQHSSRYPHLSSLGIIDMSDIPPTDVNHPDYCSVVSAFPHLRRLSLDSVASNVFIRELLPHPHSMSFPWPEFRILSICNDANVSKPLIHRILTARKAAGKPLKQLFTDGYFTNNVESWTWIRQCVEIQPNFTYIDYV